MKERLTEMIERFSDRLYAFARRMNGHELTECHDCGVREGELHKPGCDMEHCAFCGGQSLGCDCPLVHFYPSYDRSMRADTPGAKPFCGLPEAVYKDGLPPEQAAEWDRILEAKGRVPWIQYPNLCCRCGTKWPRMFMLPDEDWERYVEIEMQNKMLCWACFSWIAERIDAAAERRGKTP